MIKMTGTLNLNIQRNKNVSWSNLEIAVIKHLHYSRVYYYYQVTSDAVGFGFVLRGSCPTYVQAVDPMGPAAMAGLKVVYQLLMLLALIKIL